MTDIDWHRPAFQGFGSLIHVNCTQCLSLRMLPTASPGPRSTRKKDPRVSNIIWHLFSGRQVTDSPPRWWNNFLPKKSGGKSTTLTWGIHATLWQKMPQNIPLLGIGFSDVGSYCFIILLMPCDQGYRQAKVNFISYSKRNAKTL